MNGVDLADQYTVYFPFIRKTRKWWRKVFFWLMEVAVVNSYILYKETVVAPLSHRHFRLSLVQDLVKLSSPISIARPVRHSAARAHEFDTERLDGKTHFLGRREQRQCVVCSTPERRHSYILL